MNEQLKEISTQVGFGAHAVVCDGAGWHQPGCSRACQPITLLPCRLVWAVQRNRRRLYQGVRADCDRGREPNATFDYRSTLANTRRLTTLDTASNQARASRAAESLEAACLTLPNISQSAHITRIIHRPEAGPATTWLSERCSAPCFSAAALSFRVAAIITSAVVQRSALIQQHKLASVTQVCQSRLAFAVLQLESLAQGSVFAIFLPFNRAMPEGSIADEQGRGCTRDCGADKQR